MARLGSVEFSCANLFGSMKVCCNNYNCKYYDNTVCLLFKIDLDEEGKCKSFERKISNS